MGICYSIAKTIVRVYRLILRQDFSVAGEIDLPPGAKIIAANHPNATDGFHFPFIFKEKLHFFMQGDVFSVPLVGWLLVKCDQIKVDLKDKTAAIEEACRKLARGDTVVIFPEGKLNPHNLPIEARTGAVRMSLISGAPIVPVGCFVPEDHLYNIKVHKEGKQTQSRWQTGGRCYIRIGSPWLPIRVSLKGMNETNLSELTATLMEMVRSLAQQARMDYLNEIRGQDGSYTAANNP